MTISASLRNWHLVKKYNAKLIHSLKEAPKYPDQYVAFETENFGWILSPVPRRIVAKE